MPLTPFSLRDLSDRDLLAALRALAGRDTDLEADLLVHLGEVDARELYLGEGHPSLFAYCTEVLHFSESVAYHRITAARAARAFPRVLEAVRSGELHLSAVRLLAPQLTLGNHGELIDRARHKSKRAIEQMLADRAPKPDVPQQVRRLRVSAAVLGATVPGASSPAAPRPTFEPQCPQPQSQPQPLGAGRYKITFTARAETHAKLGEARALLRHAIPDGDLAKLFDRALEALLRELRRTKFAECERPRSASPVPTDSNKPARRHIPAAIKRAVAARDGGRCTFVTHDGRRCGSREALEFHHAQPFARSHRHRAEEITLRCRAHNRHAAILDYGADHMARFRRPPHEADWTRPGASRPTEDPAHPLRGTPGSHPEVSAGTRPRLENRSPRWSADSPRSCSSTSRTTPP